jgi:hypothetical protein
VIKTPAQVIEGGRKSTALSDTRLTVAAPVDRKIAECIILWKVGEGEW